MGLFGFLAILNNTYFIDNTKAIKSLGYTNEIQKKLKPAHKPPLICTKEGKRYSKRSWYHHTIKIQFDKPKKQVIVDLT